MRSLEEMLAIFPAKHPSEASGDELDAWYFLLPDGSLSGGTQTNHLKMMGGPEKEFDSSIETDVLRNK